MFDKLKELKNLQEQAKQMQTRLATERVTTSEGGVILTMDGNQSIVDLEIKDELLNPEKKEILLTAIKVTHKKTIKEVQKKMAEKMKASGGLENFGF